MKETKLFNRNFIFICMIGFLSSFGTSIAETLVSKYAEYLGALPSAIGLVSSVCSITALLILPISAPVLDAFRKNQIFILSTTILMIAYIGFAFSSDVNMLIVFRLLNGIGKGVSFTVCLAMAADSLPESKMSSGIVYFTLAQAISIAFAPSAGLAMLSLFDYQITFLLSAGIVCLSIGFTAFVKLPYHSDGKMVIRMDTMISKAAIPPALFMFFLTTAYSTINSFIVVYAGTLQVESIGLYFTVYSLVLLISRPLIGKLSNYFSQVQIILPTLICFAISMLLVAYASTLSLFLIAAVISAFGYGVCQPLIQSMCMERAGVNKRGVGSSTSFIGTNFGYLIGPLLGGFIANNYGYSFMYKLTIIPLGIGFIVYYIDSILYKKESTHK